MGTRNYQMEHVVATLKNLNLTLPKVESQPTGAADSKKNSKKNKTTNEAPTEAATVPIIPTSTITNGQVIIDDSVISNAAPGSTISRQIPQIKGSHISCEFINCPAELPICRLYNHIRYFHKDFYTEEKVNALLPHPSAVFTFNLPCRSYRHALKITEYGLFFLKVNVEKVSGETTIRGFVQGTCKNQEARIYKYDLDIQVGKALGKYSDLCYGYNQKDDYVERSLQCFNMSTNVNVKTMTIRLKMYRWFGTTGLKRNSETRIMAAPVPNQAQPGRAAASSQSEAPGPVPRRNRRRNRRH